MITTAYVTTMARYNAWQNGNLLAGAAMLDDARRRAEIGLFFGSIMATMNHLLWGDRSWLHRFAGTGEPRVRSIAESVSLCADWAELASERERTDRLILAWATALDPAWLDDTLTWWSAAAGREITRPRPLVVTHFFNHQTHHRGQLHAALTAAGVATEVTDLPFMPGLD
jgi:uncharacterized damage-inducible protein DinB